MPSTPIDSHARAITVIVLAAGKGTRFFESGGCVHKLQSVLAGETVIARVLQSVKAADLAYHVVHPAGPSTAGMGDSIASGVRATPDAAGWLILPADMPLIRPATLRMVADALFDDASCQAVVPCRADQPGHPVAFKSSCKAALLHLSGDFGARSILKTLSARNQVRHLPLDDEGIVCDIDTVMDLERAEDWLLKQRPPD